MTKVLVTGAAGFVGRHIVRACLERGWEVVGMDVRPAPDNGGTFLQGDFSNREDVRRAVKDMDYVFHEGAVSSSPMFVPDPSRGVEVNVMGGLYLLHAAADAGVGRFVYASTSSIYGDLPVPWREDMVIRAPPNLYAASKLAYEQLAQTYTTRGDLDTVGLRYFSIYGPGEESKGQYANMISQFLWALQKGEQPMIYGDGNQTRDFIHVDDVVRANLLAAETSSVGGVFNVGTGRETSLNILVKTLSKLLNNKIRPRYVPNPVQNYIYSTLADTSKARHSLGFKAQVSFRQGVANLVARASVT